MESSRNKSFTPLGINNIYIGSYDNVIQYENAIINLLSDTDCQIIMYQSSDTHHYQSTSYDCSANVLFNKLVDLVQPYVYFTVRNIGASAQTILNFNVLYKAYNMISNISGQNVNVSNLADLSGVNVQANITGQSQNPLMVKEKPTYSVSLDAVGKTSQVIRNSAGCLHSISISQVGGSGFAYIKLYNASSAVAGDIPMCCLSLHKDTSYFVECGNMNFSGGLCVRGTDAFDNANDVSPAGIVNLTCFLTGYSE